MDLSQLESELDSLSPPARDLPTLNSQLDQAHHFLAKLEARISEVAAVAADCKNLVKEVDLFQVGSGPANGESGSCK